MHAIDKRVVALESEGHGVRHTIDGHREDIRSLRAEMRMVGQSVHTEMEGFRSDLERHMHREDTDRTKMFLLVIATLISALTAAIAAGWELFKMVHW